MVIQRHLAASLERPCQGYQDFQCCQRYSRFELVVCAFGPGGEDWEQVARDKFCFGEASCDVESVGLFVIEFQPSLEVA
jgi:hypothetical protein